MSASPAPATVSIPPRELRNRAPKQARRESAVEAPGADYSIDISLLLARVTIRGVAGVSSAAVAEYVAILQGDLANAARLARLNAPTLPAPACEDERYRCRLCGEPAEPTAWCRCVGGSIESAVVDECEQHDPHCTDPCCVEDVMDVYCADEGHVVLSDSRGYYGVSSGGW